MNMLYVIYLFAVSMFIFIPSIIDTNSGNNIDVNQKKRMI